MIVYYNKEFCICRKIGFKFGEVTIKIVVIETNLVSDVSVMKEFNNYMEKLFTQIRVVDTRKNILKYLFF